MVLVVSLCEDIFHFNLEGLYVGFAQQSQSHASDQGGIPQEWALVCQRLQAELGDATFRSWIAPLVLTSAASGLVQLAAPTRFMKDWVASNFLTKIRNHWQDLNPTIDTIDLIVKTASAVPVAQVAMPDPMSVAPGEEVDIEGSFIGSNLDPRFTFENFVVGKPNELAYAAALRVAESATRKLLMIWRPNGPRGTIRSTAFWITRSGCLPVMI